MKSFIRFLLIILFIVTQTKSFCQIFKPFPEGFGIEIGGGQNNLFWSAPTFGLETPGTKPVDRTDFYFTPNIRITYDIQFSSKYSTLFFVGYNRFGGNNKEKYKYFNEELVSSNKYSFDVLESGSFLFWNISILDIGIGIKINHHFNVQYEPDVDRTKWFGKWSSNFGIRMMHLFSPINLSLEAWFGLNDLRNSSSVLPSGGVIRENHYRIMFGYTL